MRFLCALLVATSLLAPVRASAQQVFYNGESVLPTGWGLRGWKGVEGTVHSGSSVPGGGAALLMTPGSDAKPWAGVRYCTPKKGVSVDRALWDSGFLNIRVNTAPPSTDEKLPVQVGVMLLLEDGNTVRTKHISLNTHRIQSESDSTWISVSIPLHELTLSADQAMPLVMHIGEIVFQYIGDNPPRTKLQIAYIAIDQKPLAPASR